MITKVNKSIIIFCIFAFGFLLSNLVRSITATLTPVLTYEFDLTAGNLGLLAGGYFIGFSIGFPYLGGLNNSLSTPRLDTPRTTVPKGSIAIAGSQTGIYPLSSPGGWNLIGKTPASIFNINDPDKSLLKMGDFVRFKPINKEDFIL